jgi:hypothetical protein
MAMPIPAAPPRFFRGVFTDPISLEAVADRSSSGIYKLKCMICEMDTRLDAVLTQLKEIQQRTNALPSNVSVPALTGLSPEPTVPVHNNIPLSSNYLYNAVGTDLSHASAYLLWLSSHLDQMAEVVQGIDRALTPLGKLQTASTIRNPGFLR